MYILDTYTYRVCYNLSTLYDGQLNLLLTIVPLFLIMVNYFINRSNCEQTANGQDNKLGERGCVQTPILKGSIDFKSI